MSAPRTFGRRGAAARAASPPRRPTTTAVDSLSPQAEAFRAEIAARRGQDQASFETWRRAQGGRRALSVALTLASFSPGLISFLLQAPFWLSIGLEIAAVAGNVWLRRERWRRMREIVNWEAPADAPR